MDAGSLHLLYRNCACSHSFKLKLLSSSPASATQEEESCWAESRSGGRQHIAGRGNTPNGISVLGGFTLQKPHPDLQRCAKRLMFTLGTHCWPSHCSTPGSARDSPAAESTWRTREKVLKASRSRTEG